MKFERLFLSKFDGLKILSDKHSTLQLAIPLCVLNWFFKLAGHFVEESLLVAKWDFVVVK